MDTTMTSRPLCLAAGVAGAFAVLLAAPTPSAAQAAQCTVAQASVNATIEASMKRLEEARLTNSASAMRAATDAVQAALLDIRTQLAPCAQLGTGAADAHAGHRTPRRLP